MEGLDYREALNAVGIRGGIAGNVIPDTLRGHRQLPLRAEQDRRRRRSTHVRELFDGYDVQVDGLAPTAPGPACTCPRPRRSSRRSAVPVAAKEGWTDVARFSALGVPAVNFGPGDPNLAHHDEERVPVQQLVDAEAALLRWLA